MTPKQFQDEVTAIATHRSVPFARLKLILDAQVSHSAQLAQMRGYDALAKSFQCFVLETVECLNTETPRNLKTPVAASYLIFVQRMAQDFKSLCAAKLIAEQGYPMHGYTLLRNTFDQAVLTSAVLQGMATFMELEGLHEGQPFDPQSAKKNRKKIELKIRKLMTGESSALSVATIDNLKKWDELFDAETHGARLSMTASQDFLKGTKALPVLPVYSEKSASMFINRFCEIGWMIHRLLPLLQQQGYPFSSEWADKWRRFDECFYVIVLAMTKQLGKPIGAAIEEFVRVKFPFRQSSSFPT